MRWIKCVWTCADSGAEGLVPNIFRDWYESKDYGGYQPSTRLAHDLMAHGIKEFGTIEDELRALGAELYIREFSLDYTYEGLMYDLSNTFRDGNAQLPQMAKKVKLEDWEETQLRLILKETLAKALDSATNYPGDWGLDDLWDMSEDDEEAKDKALEAQAMELLNFEVIYSWLAFGYKYAKKRYRGNYVYGMYQAINNHLTRLHLEEGQTFSIGYCWKTDRIETREHYN